MASPRFTTYLALELECDQPILEVLGAYGFYVRQSLQIMRARQRCVGMPPLPWKLYQDPGLLMLWVREDGRHIVHAHDQTPELCIAAVQRTPQALQYVRDHTLPVCLAAVMVDGLALEYCRNETESVYIAAVTQNPEALQFVSVSMQAQYPAIALTAVRRQASALRHVCPSFLTLPLYAELVALAQGAGQ